MAELDLMITTEDSKAEWHSWFLNSPKHTTNQDRPEREVIAFATGFEIINEPTKSGEIDPMLDDIVKYVLPVMWFLSVVANTFIIKVMYNISQWKFPSCLYVVIISSMDLVVDTIRLLDNWCQVTFSVKFLNCLSLTSDAVCATFTISIYFLYHLKSLIRLALSVDLYYSFKCPLTNNKKNIVCRIQHFILLFISILLIVNSHFLWTYSLIHMNHKQAMVPPGNYCTYAVKWVSPTFRDVLWPMVDIIIGEILPIASVLLSTALIACNTSKQVICNVKSCSPKKKNQLSRYMIDVNAFIEIRGFLLMYNIISFSVVMVPSLITMIYKGFSYQKNHAMKIMTSFSTARSFTRSYINPADITILNLINQLLLLLYPVIVLLLGWCFSPNGFKKEIPSLFANVHRNRKINFLI